MISIRRWPLSFIALALFLVVLPYEGSIGNLRGPALGVLVAALLWERRQTFWTRDRPWWREWGWIWMPPGLLLIGLIFLRLAVADARGEEAEVAEVAGETLKRMGVYALTLPALLMLAWREGPGRESGAILVRSAEAAPEKLFGSSGQVIGAIHRGVLVWLALWLGWSALTAGWSANWEESLDLYSEELGPYALAYLSVVLVATGGLWQGRAVLRVLVAMAAFVGTLGVAQMIAGLFAPGTEWGEWLIDAEIMNRRWNEYREVIWRAQFPFEAHNRLASYLTVAALLVPAGSALEESPRVRWLMYAGLGLALAGIYATGTRGALLAAAAGLAVAALARPRWLGALVVLGVVVAVASPQRLMEHTATIFKEETWTNPAGSVQYRVFGWRIAGEMIRDRPIAGHGYGWKVYEELFPEYKRDPQFEEFYEQEMPHAHNNFLEVAVETGLPGLVVFVAFQLLLAAMIVSLLITAPRGSPQRRLAWAFVGMMVAIHLFGMTNYSLRRSVGFEIFAAWAMIHVFYLIAARDRNRAETREESESETRETAAAL